MYISTYMTIQSKHYTNVTITWNETLLPSSPPHQPKKKSAPVAVYHGSTVVVGGTELLCHIHAGTVTCEGCEPGLIQAGNKSAKSPVPGWSLLVVACGNYVDVLL